LGLDVVYVSGSKLVLNNYHILEYDKDIYKNLDYISGAMTCLSIVEFWLAITVLVTLNNPSVKVVVKRYFDMFLRFVVLFVFIIVVIEFSQKSRLYIRRYDLS
jgi:hypothetical protein